MMTISRTLIARFSTSSVAFVCAALLLASCRRQDAGISTTVSSTAASPSVSSRSGALPFIEDDYSRALADAVRRKVPLFVEAWATW